jgi:RING finger protein 121
MRVVCGTPSYSFINTVAISGWLIIGKKETCAYCKEKVDMRQFKGNNPWQTTQAIYLSILDGVRYLMVWNPIILVAVHLLFNLFGLHPSGKTS